MSQRLEAGVTMPEGPLATPVSILQSVSDVIGQIETQAADRGLKPVWDRFALELEEQEEEIFSFAQKPRTRRRLRGATIAVDPKEVSE
ncbi:hypothetical protein MRBLMI12_000437 [Microbacterium sp. LMI12-1-1.1]|uniref:hypothetical protein n=1 Tax=Microbacterium sp. LMI12-1-1.1 TaxID=3135225 RepID=UPI0034409009